MTTLAELQSNPHLRNVRLKGTHLVMQQAFEYETHYEDDLVDYWSQGGLLSPREPTVEEVESWLAEHKK
jgi:hypothetical protein